MNIKYFLLVLIAVLFFNCQNSTSSDSETVINPTEKEKIATSVDNPTPSSVVSNSAVSELKQEKPLSTYAQQFYGNALWHYDTAVVIKNPEKSKSYNGKWVKFHPNNTLETGFYDGPVTQGSWAIDEATNILTILESGEHPTYSEWKVKTSSSSEAIMIWVGTKRFGLNNTQIKMLRHNNKPSNKKE